MAAELQHAVSETPHEVKGCVLMVCDVQEK
jgi:hypothetical protein